MPTLSSAGTSDNPFSLDRVSSVGRTLATHAEAVDRAGVWPAESLRCCREADVFRWFIPQDYGGWGWSEGELVESYLALSQGCLTTTFILTQWQAACRRICASANHHLREQVLPRLAAGEQFVTIGISQLTTSRQHCGQPTLRATKVPQGYRLDGYSPWVTRSNGIPIADGTTSPTTDVSIDREGGVFHNETAASRQLFSLEGHAGRLARSERGWIRQ